MPAAIDRTRILESVLAAWRQDGYRGATTRKIAALAGVTEMTLFRRFGDKPALFSAALELETARFAANSLPYTGELDADLERIVHAYQAVLDRNASIVLDFLLEAPRSSELAEVGPVPLGAIGSIAQVIARYQGDGRLQEEPPLSAVAALLSPVLMMTLLRRAQPAVAPAVFDTALHVRSFVRGRAPPNRGAA